MKVLTTAILFALALSASAAPTKKAMGLRGSHKQDIYHLEEWDVVRALRKKEKNEKQNKAKKIKGKNHEKQYVEENEAKGNNKNGADKKKKDGNKDGNTNNRINGNGSIANLGKGELTSFHCTSNDQCESAHCVDISWGKCEYAQTMFCVSADTQTGQKGNRCIGVGQPYTPVV